MTNGIEFGLLLGSLAVDLVAIGIIMTVGYYRSERNASYLFTLVLVNVLVFLVTHLMLIADLSAGVGFGMFALFGIMRFRTATLPIQEMTYLFTAIVVAVINGVSIDLLSALELGTINAIAVVTVLSLSSWANSKPRTLSLLYDRVEYLPVDRRAELIADLEQRIGETVLDVSVVRVNLLNDTVDLLLSIGAPLASSTTIDLVERRSASTSAGPDGREPGDGEDAEVPGAARGARALTQRSSGKSPKPTKRLLHWTVGSR